MVDGKVKGYFVVGENPAVGSANSKMQRLGLAGAGLAAVAGKRRRWPGVTGGALLFAGAAVERFAVLAAGQQSARDPKYTVGPQRARIDAGANTP